MIPEGEESSSSEEDGDDDDDEDYDEDDDFDIKYDDDEEDEGEKVEGDSGEEDGSEREDGGSEGRGKGRKKKAKAAEEADASDTDGDDESDSSKPKEKEKRKTRKERKLEQAIAASKAAQGIADAPEPEEEVEVNELRKKATGFIGLAKDATRSEEEVLSTPLPGETLALFYARSRTLPRLSYNNVDIALIHSTHPQESTGPNARRPRHLETRIGPKSSAVSRSRLPLIDMKSTSRSWRKWRRFLRRRVWTRRRCGESVQVEGHKVKVRLVGIGGKDTTVRTMT